ncbi:MAG: hypothetical protein GX900_07780 [Clostridiaceae bacterium]|nr:hypothetical protein [Clostridiaceae bacterium]
MAISAESGWVLPIAILITATMVATVPRIMTEHEALARREVRFADDMRDNSSLYQRTWRDYAGHELGEYDVVLESKYSTPRASPQRMTQWSQLARDLLRGLRHNQMNAADRNSERSRLELLKSGEWEWLLEGGDDRLVGGGFELLPGGGS